MMNLALPTYCERLLTGQEWLNAGSSLAFLLASLAAVPLALRGVAMTGRVFALRIGIALLPVPVGIGSLLFHLHPTPLTQLADVIPILLFCAVSISWLLQARLGWSRSRQARWLLGWLGASVLAGLAGSHLLAGGAFYLPTLVLLAMLARAAPPGPTRQALARITGLFLLAWAARGLDLPLCAPLDAAGWQHGLHLAWHLVNAVTVASILALLLRPETPGTLSPRA